MSSKGAEAEQTGTRDLNILFHPFALLLPRFVAFSPFPGAWPTWQSNPRACR